VDYSLRTCKAPFQQSINGTILNDNDTLIDNGNGNGNGISVPLKFADIKKNDLYNFTITLSIMF
jgi:hypothetical protein